MKSMRFTATVGAVLFLVSCASEEKGASPLASQFHDEINDPGDGSFMDLADAIGDAEELEDTTIEAADVAGEAPSGRFYFAACTRKHGLYGTAWRSKKTTQRGQAKYFAKSHNQSYRQHGAKIYLTRR